MVSTQVKNETSQDIKLLYTNAVGLRNGKVKSLKQEILHTKANIMTIQETHYAKKGRFQMKKHDVFLNNL